jgi:hypothetical protein
VLEQTDPNAPEVLMLRQVLQQEQNNQAMTAQQPPQQQIQPMPQQQQQYPMQQPIHAPFPPQITAQVPLATQASHFQPQQQLLMMAPPSPALPTDSVAVVAAPAQAAALPSIPLVSAATVLSSFWSADVRHWCLELDEELKTATIALGQLLEITRLERPPPSSAAGQDDEATGQAANEAYRKRVAEFEHILTMSHMLDSFGLPSHVASMLPSLPAELLASIRGAAHRLEATKKALHSFLSLVHSSPDDPDALLVRELRQTILDSSVTQLPAPTIEQMASSVAHDIASKQNKQNAAAASAAAAAAAAVQQTQAQVDSAMMRGGYSYHPQQHQQLQPSAFVRPAAFQPIHPQSHAAPAVHSQQQQQQPHARHHAAPAPAPAAAAPRPSASHMRSHTISTTSTAHAHPRRWN